MTGRPPRHRPSAAALAAAAAAEAPLARPAEPAPAARRGDQVAADGTARP